VVAIAPVDVDAAAVRETHLSVLYFLDDLVVKVKKPLRLPFVDFSTPEARRAACEEEVRVNRRLAPDVYLGVAPTRLGGRVVDDGVVMRRLPPERSLAALVRAGDGRVPAGIDALASVLATFHECAPRSDDIDRGGEVGVVRSTWDGLVSGLAPFAGTAVDAAVVAEADRLARRFLEGRRPLFAGRVAAHRVCDGHGDLLASDVFLLDDGPRVLDAVEFDPRLRHVDVIADVAFLAMDLERIGAPGVAQQFLAAYQSAAGDVFPTSLVHYYCAARAMVRAVVACLRAAQRTAERAAGGPPAELAEAEALVELARDHLEAGRVVLGVVSGLPGTGKSTVAASVGAALGWPVLRSDEIRREVTDGSLDGPLVAPFLLGAYGTRRTELTYRTMLERARVALGHGQSVILDATFTNRRWQRAAEALAAHCACDLAVVETVAPVAVAASRARARLCGGTDISGADEDVVRELAALAHPWAAAVPLDTVALDAAGAGAEACRVLRARDPVASAA
jgi:aminoglycoside phosphotransferase family enzyme/predicted kinase